MLLVQRSNNLSAEELQEILLEILTTKDIGRRSPLELNVLSIALESVEFFRKLSEMKGKDSLKLCANHLRLDQHEAQKDVISHGEKGDKFYIILTGVLEVHVPTSAGTFVKVSEMKSGQSFGELALINDAPRRATIRSVTECHLAVLQKKDYLKIIVDMEQMEIARKIEFLQVVAFFDRTDRRALHEYIYYFKIVNFKWKEIVYAQDELPLNVYVIKEGEFVLQHSNKGLKHHQQKSGLFPSVTQVAILGPGEIFGEVDCLLKDRKRVFSVSCNTQSSEVFVISKQHFMERIMDNHNLKEVSFIEEYLKGKLKWETQRLSELVATKKLTGEGSSRLFSPVNPTRQPSKTITDFKSITNGGDNPTQQGGKASSRWSAANDSLFHKDFTTSAALPLPSSFSIAHNRFEQTQSQPASWKNGSDNFQMTTRHRAFSAMPQRTRSDNSNPLMTVKREESRLLVSQQQLITTSQNSSSVLERRSTSPRKRVQLVLSKSKQDQCQSPPLPPPPPRDVSPLPIEMKHKRVATELIANNIERMFYFNKVQPFDSNRQKTFDGGGSFEAKESRTQSVSKRIDNLKKSSYKQTQNGEGKKMDGTNRREESLSQDSMDEAEIMKLEMLNRIKIQICHQQNIEVQPKAFKNIGIIDDVELPVHLLNKLKSFGIIMPGRKSFSTKRPASSSRISAIALAARRQPQHNYLTDRSEEFKQTVLLDDSISERPATTASSNGVITRRTNINGGQSSNINGGQSSNINGSLSNSSNSRIKEMINTFRLIDYEQYFIHSHSKNIHPSFARTGSAFNTQTSMNSTAFNPTARADSLPQQSFYGTFPGKLSFSKHRRNSPNTTRNKRAQQHQLLLVKNGNNHPLGAGGGWGGV